MGVLSRIRFAKPSRVCAQEVEHSAPSFIRGQGSWLWSEEGRAYLDFYQGAAANSLGHSPEVLVNTLNAQAQAVLHTGYPSRPAHALAERLCQATGSDQAYLFNSGSDACEAAIRLARRWGLRYRNGAGGIITARHGCHGRHLTAHDRTEVPFNDLPALHAAVDSRTVAIMLEPIQGAAGVIPASELYLKGVERLCRELGILLILDEVQTGMGRCGALLAEQTYGVRADILAVGKGLGGGLPMGAVLARGKACCLEPADLGFSHQGNALMSMAGLAVLNAILAPGLLAQVADSGRYLRDGLVRLAHRHGQGIVRGQGLLWGLQLSDDGAQALVKAARQEGLLLSAPQADCLRFTPALNVSKGNIDDMLLRLARAFARVRTAQLQARKH
ncbi:MAG: aminotransferase class III-fold pyridoxal phosphate-dependent enzyme [Pseudomonas sp.]|nr:aminotransferase class III-fold pyridoxal phosphate-dependent enzyme [Pseudomonas sp.]